MDRLPAKISPQGYVVIHGHFYQPPRENPWIEQIEVEPSAAPFHDWNTRITAECYRPNAAARVYDGQGRILDIVDNYRHLSFNFGPTLISWLKEQAPDTYAKILEADAQSLAALGHGNAIAQAYNHAILPLASARDRETQVIWGLKDFEHRFRRPGRGHVAAGDRGKLPHPGHPGGPRHEVRDPVALPGQAGAPPHRRGVDPGDRGPGYHPGLPLFFARARGGRPEAALH